MNEADGNIDVRFSLIVRYREMVLRTVRAIVSNPEDVEDVVQDTFVKALSALTSYDADKASFATWLSRIAYRTALNHLRDYKHHARVDDIDVADGNGGHSADTEALIRAIDMLPAEDRAILNMYYYQDMRLADISYVTGCNIRTVATRLFRIRKRLAMIIKTLEKE